MAKNDDGFEAGQPVSFEDIAAAERKKKRAAIEPAPAPKPAAKTTAKKTAAKS